MTLTQGVPPTARTLSHRSRGQASTPDKSSESCALGNHTYPHCTPSRSQRADAVHLKRLASEVRVVWLDPAGRHLPWLRESFARRRPTGDAVRAVTLDDSGRVVRVFSVRTDALAAYAKGFAEGLLTCPIEGVLPRSIVAGRPAEPAHRQLALMAEAGIGLGEVFPVWFDADGTLRPFIGALDAADEVHGVGR